MKKALVALLATVAVCAGCKKHELEPEFPFEYPAENPVENPVSPIEDPADAPVEVPVAFNSIVIDGENYELKSGFYTGYPMGGPDGDNFCVLLASEELSLSELCDVMADYKVENDMVFAVLQILTNVPEGIEDSEYSEDEDSEGEEGSEDGEDSEEEEGSEGEEGSEDGEDLSKIEMGTVTLVRADGTRKQVKIYYSDLKAFKTEEETEEDIKISFTINFTGTKGVSLTGAGVEEEYTAALSGNVTNGELKFFSLGFHTYPEE